MDSNSIYNVLKKCQDGGYDPLDKIRHESNCPKEVGIMRLFELFDGNNELVFKIVEILRQLEKDGRIVVHNSYSIEMSFEAI